MSNKYENRTLQELIGEQIVPSAPDPRFTETIHEPTPNGGAYSTAYFYDKEGNPCAKEVASRINIVEYDSDGKRINESYGCL